MTENRFWTSFSVKDEVGSSIIKIWVFKTKALLISTICWLATERSPTLSRGEKETFSSFKTCWLFLSISARSKAPAKPTGSLPKNIFSATVSSRTTVNS